MTALETLGCIKLYQEELYRNPLDILQITEREALFELSGDQKKVYDGIKRLLSSYAAKQLGSEGAQNSRLGIPAQQPDTETNSLPLQGEDMAKQRYISNS